MRTFKRVYYPIIGLLALALLIMSIMDVTHGAASTKLSVTDAKAIAAQIGSQPHSVEHTSAHTAVKDYIVSKLNEFGVAEAEDVQVPNDTYGRLNQAAYATDSSNKPVPTFVTQEAELTYLKVAEYYTQNDLGTPVVRDFVINNIIVSFPAKQSGADTLLFVAHYDSFGETSGATETGVPVAAALINIKNLIDNPVELNNNVVFLFADYGNVDDLGVYAFRYNFKGFNSLADSVDMVVSVEAGGTGGATMLYETRGAGYTLVKNFAKAGNSVRVNSMFSFIYERMYSEATSFSDKVTASFVNIGRGENYLTRNDTADNLSEVVIGQQLELVSRIINRFGNEPLTGLRTNMAKDAGVYFNYLSFFTVYYPIWCSFLFAAIILALIAGVVALNFFKKSFDFKRCAIGAVVSILGVVVAAFGVFAAYYIFGAMAAGFGLITFKGLAAGITFSSTGLMIGAMLLATACAIAAYCFFKWLFNIKVMDVIRGNIFVTALLAAATGFFAPAVGFVLCGLAISELVAVLVAMLMRERFKDRFGMDIDRLFLTAIPLIIFAPVVLSNLILAAQVVGVMYYFAIMGIFALFIGHIAPYFAYLKPVLQRVADKMPERTIRKQTLVTERVPHPTKRGKFIEEQIKKNFEEKAPRRYEHWVGISAIALISAIMLVCFGLFGSNVSKNLTHPAGEVDAKYDDSVVFSVKGTFGSSTGFSPSSAEWLIYDRDAAAHITRSMRDFEYDDVRELYYMTFSQSLQAAVGPSVTTSVAGTTKSITFNQPNNDITYTVRLYSSRTRDITQITVNHSGTQSYSHKFDKSTEITLTLRGTVTLEIEGSNEYTGGIGYTEHSRSQNVFDSYNFSDEIRAMMADFDVLYELKCEVSV